MLVGPNISGQGGRECALLTGYGGAGGNRTRVRSAVCFTVSTPEGASNDDGMRIRLFSTCQHSRHGSGSKSFPQVRCRFMLTWIITLARSHISRVRRQTGQPVDRGRSSQPPRPLRRVEHAGGPRRETSGLQRWGISPKIGRGQEGDGANGAVFDSLGLQPLPARKPVQGRWLTARGSGVRRFAAKGSRISSMGRGHTG